MKVFIMMYVYGEETLAAAIVQWRDRKIKEQPDMTDEINRHTEMIMDFMCSEEIKKNKMFVEAVTDK